MSCMVHDTDMCLCKKNMDLDDYQKACMRSFKPKPGWSEQDTKAALAAMGMAGEVGECVEPIKKWFFHGGKLTTDQVREKLFEELGDVMWYVACAADAFGLSLQDIAQNNIEKLLKRYPERAK